MFERLMPLINEETFKKIQNSKILLVGVGGVGGFALEALARSGFLNITIVDGDKVALSNLNRQIISNKDNLNKDKTEVAKDRILSINDNINVKTINTFLAKDNFSKLINEKYNYIIDACDDIKIKIELIKYAQKNNIKIITCLGTGKKFNPKELEITTLNKTFNDPLAKKLRSELRKEKIDLKIPVVFSKELAKKTNNVVASCIFVPSVAGIYLSYYIFNDIIKN